MIFMLMLMLNRTKITNKLFSQLLTQSTILQLYQVICCSQQGNEVVFGGKVLIWSEPVATA